MKKSDLPSYPSMAACSAATGIPLPLLKQAKRAGCPAFDQGNRVHLGPLLQWLFRPDADDGGDSTDWHNRHKRAVALMAEAELALKKGSLVERAWVAERIIRMFGDINAYRIRSESEDAVKFAATGGDIALCRTKLRGIWDGICLNLQSLSKHLEENEHTDKTNP